VDELLNRCGVRSTAANETSLRALVLAQVRTFARLCQLLAEENAVKKDSLYNCRSHQVEHRAQYLECWVVMGHNIPLQSQHSIVVTGFGFVRHIHVIHHAVHVGNFPCHSWPSRKTQECHWLAVADAQRLSYSDNQWRGDILLPV
jgi:hypothetical protein